MEELQGTAQQKQTDQVCEKVPLPGRQATGRQRSDKKFQTLTASFREPET